MYARSAASVSESSLLELSPSSLLNGVLVQWDFRSGQMYENLSGPMRLAMRRALRAVGSEQFIPEPSPRSAVVLQ